MKIQKSYNKLSYEILDSLLDGDSLTSTIEESSMSLHFCVLIFECLACYFHKLKES